MQRPLVLALIAVGLFSLQLPSASATTSGSLDRTFAGDGIAYLPHAAYAVAVQPDGKILVAGGGLTRYNRDGSVDRTFSGDGQVPTPFAGGAYFGAVVVQPNGRIVVGGTAETKNNHSAFAFARYMPDGSLDASFSGNGKLAAIKVGSWNASEISDVAFGPHTIVASAYFDDGRHYVFGVLRLTRRGTPDTSFSGDGVAVTRFDPHPAAFAESVAVQPDGAIVAAGSVRSSSNEAAGFAVARYLSDGTHDASFDGNGKRTLGFGGSWSGASDLALQSDGKIVITGTVHNGPSSAYGPLSIALARCNSDGTLDDSFAGDGKRVTSGSDGNLRAAAVAIQSDGKIVVGGEATPTFDEYPTNFALARYTAGGVLDTSFAGDGIRVMSFRLDDWIDDIALQSNGKIVVVGASQGQPPRGYAVARYLA